MKPLNLEKQRKLLQTLKSIPLSEKWFKLPTLSEETIEEAFSSAEFVNENLYGTQFLLHLGRLAFQRAIFSDQFTPADLFIPRPEFRLIARSEIMAMHQSRNRGVIDQWGSLFNSKKKFRQFFTTNVLAELEKDGLIKLVRGKGSSTWNSVFLTTKGWLVAVILEFNVPENLTDNCSEEALLLNNSFREIYACPRKAPSLFQWLRGSVITRLDEFLSNEDSHRIVLLSNHNDGSTMVLKSISGELDQRLIFYVDLSLLAKPVNKDLQEVFLSFVDQMDLTLNKKEALYSALTTSSKRKKSWIRNAFDNIRDLGIWHSIWLVLDHADLMFLHADMFKNDIGKLLKDLVEGQATIPIILSLKQLYSSIPSTYAIFRLAPIPLNRFTVPLLYERRRHCLNSKTLSKNLEDLDPQFLERTLSLLEVELDRSMPMNSLLLFGERVAGMSQPLEKGHFTQEMVTGRSLMKELLELPFGQTFLEHLWNAYSSLHATSDIPFPSPRGMFRTFVDVHLELDAVKDNWIYFDRFFFIEDKYIKINSDYNLRLLASVLKELSFSEDEIELLQSMETFNQIFKSWKETLTIYNLPSSEEFEQFLEEIQEVLLTPAKISNLNLEQLSIGIAMAILAGVIPPDHILEFIFPYLEDTLIEILSILQSALMPLHERRQMLETFSMNLLNATKVSPKLRKLAGIIIECFLHLPPTFSMDLLNLALTWTFPSKEKMVLLIDSLLATGSELIHGFTTQVSYTLPLKASLHPDPEEINDSFLLLFVKKFLEKHLDIPLLVRTVDDLLQGFFDVDEDILLPFRQFVASKAPILVVLLDLLYPCNPKRRIFGYNEFFLTPLYLLSFSGRNSGLEETLKRDPPPLNDVRQLFSSLLDTYLSFREGKFGGLLLDELEEMFFQGHALRNFLENKKLGLLLMGEYAYAFNIRIQELWNLQILNRSYKSLLLEHLRYEWDDLASSTYSRLSQFVRKLYRESLQHQPLKERANQLQEFMELTTTMVTYFDNAMNIVVPSIFPNSYSEFVEFCNILLDLSETWQPEMILEIMGFIIAKMYLFEQLTDEIHSVLTGKRSAKPLIQQIAFFKSSFAQAVSRSEVVPPKSLATYLHDFLFILALIGSEYDENSTPMFHRFLPHAFEILALGKNVRTGTGFPFDWLTHLSSQLTVIILSHLLFSGNEYEALRQLTSQKRVEELANLVSGLWEQQNIPQDFLVSLYYRLMELLIFSLKQESEASSISILTLLTHAFSRWQLEDPSSVINSMFASKNLSRQSDFHLFLIDAFHRSFLNATQNFSSLHTKKRAKITKFLGSQEWFVRDLFSPFLSG